MKIGKNLKDIRSSKGLSIEAIAKISGINIDVYKAIEGDEAEVTLSQLQIFANVFSCSPIYILQFKESGGSIYNHFENSEGNNGINVNVQGIDQKEIRNAFKELYQDELKRIPKLEKLLRDNNIELDF
ncbi:helix-turn-helix domain-containing protein [Algoriphagus sp. D3-2-R+10]|uniref:helix-turn-helix domain-containing protein n=1 Tax=Algoriphagus aurantiacus TaxID=3103948 RepID=UPI002B3EB532|nr:helix-turn-helix domain-containing protein [Algoriphagus sp. D3-2-R+10]MEB2778616.1 helix-turn-helix domain-containing protein [Algoriphagus sp. D3-2-R+10]